VSAGPSEETPDDHEYAFPQPAEVYDEDEPVTDGCFGSPFDNAPGANDDIVNACFPADDDLEDEYPQAFADGFTGSPFEDTPDVVVPPVTPPAQDPGGPQGGLKKRRRRRARDDDDRSYDLSEGFSGRLVPMGVDDPPTLEVELRRGERSDTGEAAPDTALADALRAALAAAKADGKRQKAEAMELAKRLQLEEEELEELLLLIAAM
jgi:hypothetical protein